MLIIFINFDNNNFIFYRESETLQTQLSAALRQIEPLKQVSYNNYVVVFQMGYICDKIRFCWHIFLVDLKLRK